MMKLLSLFISFFLCTILFAQDKENQNVELPDFVITGKNVVNIQSVNKKAPPILPIISKDFLQPVYSTENLKVSEIKSKNLSPLNFKEKIDFFNGNLELRAGNYSLPEGNINFSQPFTNGLFYIKLDGGSLKAHEDNSDQTYLKGKANIDLFIKNNSDVFPGAKISFGGSYKTNEFKFYAVTNPMKRTLNKGNFSFGFQNLQNRQFAFAVKVTDDFYSFKSENFDENLITINGYTKIGLEKFDVASNIIYKKQSLTDSTGSSINDNYLFANPRANLNFIDEFKVSLGFTYSHVTGNDYYAPFASVSIGLGSNVTVIGEYSPMAEFISQGMMLDRNKYFNTNGFTNLFFKKTNSIDISLKYEYLKLFEMDLGFNYYSTPNQPYFNLTNLFSSIMAPFPATGEFYLTTANAKSTSGYIKLLLNPGINGILTAEITYNSIEDNSGNKIPYSPQFRILANYSYDFNSSIKIEPSVKYFSNSYVDIANTVEIKPFVDLGLRITKKLNNNFYVFIEGTNLLNHSNYIYDGYKELPISVNGGISIRW